MGRKNEVLADGLPAGALGTSITVTIDRYGHLLPGGEAEAAALLDGYHGRRQEAFRRQQRREPVMV